jgi:hypothetical protein
MTILRIESLTYGVENLETSKRYYDDWGLQSVEDGRHGVDYELPSGQTIRLRRAGDRTLPAPIERGSTIRELVWGVEDAASLDLVGAALEGYPDVEPLSGSTLHTHDPSGLGIAFAIAKPRTSPSPAVRDVNRPFEAVARVRPWRIGHAVFNVPESKLLKTSDFYMNRLQFRLSDRVTHFGDFMRCSGSVDHHNLFLLQKEDAALNHVAFEVGNFDEVIIGGKQMLGHGWTSATNLGRHIMGSNVFWYFNNPGGGLTEYFTDMDVLNDNWKPRTWDANPGFAQWMT